LSSSRAVHYLGLQTARDQYRILEKLADSSGITVAVFDGDTSMSERKTVLHSPPDVIISNFDTVEYHLRNGTEFARLLSQISFVVVDELHTYVGAFGSHVHFIHRRLQRIVRGSR